MRKLNTDLTFREIYLSVRQRKNIEFLANRNDIGFQNIENDFKGINFNYPFPLNEMQNLEVIIDILLQESIGKVNMEPYQKLRLLVKIFNGQAFYQRTADINFWRVMVIF